ncbi:AAA family ATPase [Brevibacillus daliensis]|uniref:AAA family ATPase n=1 Tax=Brevibacillus daliensis TaxID=2892995 RepID=UPI001E5D62DC|nr:AAA family ATPase [Brevibacillus daliensis]
MAVGEQLLSKIIDANDPGILTRYNVSEQDFPTVSERQTYHFIREYAEANRGQAPDYRTVVAKCDKFTYMPEVGDTFEYLVKSLKDAAAKREFHRVLSDPKTDEDFQKKSFEEFSTTLQKTLERITIETSVRGKVGTDLKSETDAFLEEYKRRKEGQSFKIWKSKFSTINREIGGYFSGSMYTWYARSGRGKSVLTLEEAIEAAFQGATVLVWAMEMSRFEVMARAYTSISARLGVCSTKIDGIDYEAGFDNKALLAGKLPEEFEQALVSFFGQLHEKIPGRIVIRAVDDEDFSSRKVSDLEADILAVKPDVVVIDPFYYLDYEPNTSRTTGGDAMETSKKLRRVAGRTRCVFHVITQADEVKDDKDDEGNRELRPPVRAEIKKTKQVLEDATNVFGIDTCDGRGIIELGKGRNGGEGAQVEVVYLPNFGIVNEQSATEAAGKFELPF